jgi:methionine-rich copper-binding protein CopC
MVLTMNQHFGASTMKRIKTAAIVAFLVMLAPEAAFAHAKMTSSTPKDGSTVAAGLSQIELNFSHPLRLSVVHVRDATKHDVPLRSELPKAFAAVVKINVDGLTPGAYEVSWTAVADDGHVMKGTFAFSVKADALPAK